MSSIDGAFPSESIQPFLAHGDLTYITNCAKFPVDRSRGFRLARVMPRMGP